ncbi:hypothetical protein Tco_1394944 [Tanacetum coccineum]
MRLAHQDPDENKLHNKIDDIGSFIRWYCRRIGKEELSKADLEGPAFMMVKGFHENNISLQFQMEECHKLLTNQIDLVNPEGHRIVPDISNPLPLGGPPGQVTIQPQFFFNKDLKYLLTRDKERNKALSISKLKAALYQDFGLEELVPSLWIKSEQVYDISEAYGITYWWFSRKQFYINKHSEPSDRDAVRSHMQILSVISIKTYERYRYNYLREIVLRRADYNDYKISEKDFKSLHPNDFEDLNILHIQGNLDHLPKQDKVNLHNAISLWTRNNVLRKSVEDLQLGIESYQTKLNLEQPNWDASDFPFKEDYIIVFKPRVVTYRDRDDNMKMIRIDEVHKFSDGTLTRIKEKLDFMVKDLKLFKFNKGMKNRKWTEDDKRRSEDFIENIRVKRRFFTMKMEILLEPTSNKLLVGDLCDSTRINLVSTGKKRCYERPHKGVKASANSDIVYFHTSAQDGDPLQDDVRLCLGDDLKKAQDHNQRQYGDEHLDTIYTVENLVSIPSEFEEISDDTCDVPECDESSLIITTFSNPLFDSNDDFTSSDVESLFDEDVSMENFKIYLNPLFEDEEIIPTKLDPHSFTAKSNLIKSLLNRDTLIDSSPKFDYLLEEFSDLIPPRIEKADFDLEEEIHLVKNLSYDNSYPRPPKELNVEISYTILESLSPPLIPVEDSDSHMEEFDLFLASDDLMPSGIEDYDYDSEGDIYFLEELVNNDSLPLLEFESFHFDLSSPRPPPEPPDVEISLIIETDAPVINNVDKLNEDECFNPGGGKINVEVDDSFTFVIQTFLTYLTYLEVSPLLSSTKNEDTIFDPGIST